MRKDEKATEKHDPVNRYSDFAEVEPDESGAGGTGNTIESGVVLSSQQVQED